jgi:predicted HNH restriction endonuclease
VVHHVVPVAQAPDRTFDPCNVVVLCNACHRMVHAGAPLNCSPTPEAERGLLS